MRIDLVDALPAGWREAMLPHLDRSVTTELSRFVGEEYQQHEVFPPREDLFTAFRLCPVEEVRVLILGQDPYHRPGQAHGLSFSVRAGVKCPPSLRNIFAELHTDLGVPRPTDGDLTRWAEQGVLLLNAILTVRMGEPNAHAKHGWEHFTDAAIAAVNAWPERVVFLLWGAYARQKTALVTGEHHVVLESGHPSPMNPKGFLGSKPFSRSNEALAQAGRAPIRWA